MKRILILGATGFIGRNLVEYYTGLTGWDVHGVYNIRPAYSHPGLTWHRANLTDAQAVGDLLAQSFDVVLQAAATTSGAKDITTRPHIHIADNAVMNSLLFRAAHDHNVGHLVFFSCTLMYQSATKPVKETDFDANAPLYPTYYGIGWTKLYLEKIGKFYAGLGRTKYTMLRHSNVFGPYDKYDLERSHMFGATVTKVMTDQTGTLTVWGPGTEARDLLHVDDLTRAVAACVERQPASYGLYNVGSGMMVPVKDVVAKIIAASGKDIAIQHDLSAPSFDFQLALDCGRIQQEVGWTPEISLEAGIRQTLNWYRHTILEA